MEINFENIENQILHYICNQTKRMFQIEDILDLYQEYKTLPQPKQEVKLKSKNHLTIRIEEFEADVFRQLMEYIHTGRLDLQPRTIIGETICLKPLILFMIP